MYVRMCVKMNRMNVFSGLLFSKQVRLTLSLLFSFLAYLERKMYCATANVEL